jgi:hypothetical protein
MYMYKNNVGQGFSAILLHKFLTDIVIVHMHTTIMRMRHYASSY